MICPVIANRDIPRRPAIAFKSAGDYHEFVRCVRREFRYAQTLDQRDFLEAINATSQSRSFALKTGNKLWRAQLGHDWDDIPCDGWVDSYRVPHPRERMIPLPDKASDGRANPKGIACLYMATCKLTAVLEVRPLIGSSVSVAQLEVLKDLRLVNCSTKEAGNLEFLRKDLTLEDMERIVWTDINDAYSRPSQRGDESIDYVPTQIIAETFKMNGFDGIAYKSSYGEIGFNVVLFDITAANIISRQLHDIKDVSVTMSEAGNPIW